MYIQCTTRNADQHSYFRVCVSFPPVGRASRVYFRFVLLLVCKIQPHKDFGKCAIVLREYVVLTGEYTVCRIILFVCVCMCGAVARESSGYKTRLLRTSHQSVAICAASHIRKNNNRIMVIHLLVIASKYMCACV